jgi:dTDP-4-amino-4,6-dideoxygalactose transaminase
MPLIALGYGHGDAVFIPGFTYNATANAVLLAGATPVLVDIDPATFNMDAADLERKIQKVKGNRNLRARAIMPVDLYGLPADYAALESVAEAHGLRIVADAAQAFGGRQGNKWIGTLAEISATSFYPTKTLGGYGDGGAIMVRDKEVGDLLRSIRWHGTGDNRKESVRVGINGRCDSIQCAVVSEKLGIFEDERQRRIQAASIYNERLTGKVDGQIVGANEESAYGLYTVRVPDRDAVRASLQEKGVPTAIYYDTPIHQMPAFEQFAPPGGLPECERASREVLSLPMHPYLSEDQIHRVCDALLATLQR